SVALAVVLYWSLCFAIFLFFFSSRRRHTSFSRDWSSDVCSSDLSKDRGGRPSSLRSPARHVRAGSALRRSERAGAGVRTGAGREIGRASCREPVYIPVGDVAR